MKEVRAARFSAYEYLYVGLTLVCYVTAVTFYRSSDIAAARSPISVYIFALVLLFAVISSCFEVWLSERWKYTVALVVHGLLVVAVVPIFAGIRPLGLCVISPLIIGICLHTELPRNIIISVVALLAIVGMTVIILVSRGYSNGAVLLDAVELVVIETLLAMFTGLMIAFREKYIDVRTENERLDKLVDRLSRANLEYQEYAKSIEEASTEAERKRITRDIHDIVGYTLTNNITMMEAVTDIMRVNPLGVGTLVRSARENAEEGLGRIREALDILRGQQEVYPKGRLAVERMITIFSRATGVDVEYDIPERVWANKNDIEETIYHLVQESMLNSFRHGKASRVRIFMSRMNGSVQLIVRDNGTPGAAVKEDIGLAGMRERVESLGGNLLAGPLRDGFEVKAAIPVQTEYTGDERE